MGIDRRRRVVPWIHVAGQLRFRPFRFLGCVWERFRRCHGPMDACCSSFVSFVRRVGRSLSSFCSVCFEFYFSRVHRTSWVGFVFCFFLLPWDRMVWVSMVPPDTCNSLGSLVRRFFPSHPFVWFGMHVPFPRPFHPRDPQHRPRPVVPSHACAGVDAMHLVSFHTPPFAWSSPFPRGRVVSIVDGTWSGVRGGGERERETDRHGKGWRERERESERDRRAGGLDRSHSMGVPIGFHPIPIVKKRRKKKKTRGRKGGAPPLDTTDTQTWRSCGANTLNTSHDGEIRTRTRQRSQGMRGARMKGKRRCPTRDAGNEGKRSEKKKKETGKGRTTRDRERVPAADGSCACQSQGKGTRRPSLRVG